MPIYDYRCTDCGHSFDHLQKLSDPLLIDCPACGESSLEKLLSAPAVQVRGSRSAAPMACGAGPEIQAACPHAHGPGCGHSH
jgi:putative FmdB family regulatory protein